MMLPYLSYVVSLQCSYIIIIQNMTEACEQQPSKLKPPASKPAPLEHCPAKEQFKQDYSQQVVYPGTIGLSMWAIILYVLYIGCDLIMFNAKTIESAESERSYLVGIEDYVEDGLRSRISAAKMLLDYYQETAAIIATNTTTNVHSNWTCDDSKYYCNSPPAQSVPGYAEHTYAFVMASYEHMIKPTSMKQDTQIFLYTGTRMLQYRLPVDLGYRVAPQLLQIVASHSTMGYLLKLVKKVIDQNTRLIKVLLCGWVPSINAQAKICILTPGSLNVTKQHWENRVIIINQSMYRVTPTSSRATVQAEGAVSHNNIQSQLAEQMLSMSIPAEHHNFYGAYHLESCVQNHRKTQYLIQNKVRICNPPQMLNILSPVIVYIYSTVQLESRYFREDMKMAARMPSFEINFLIFSNSTFRLNENDKLTIMSRRHAFTAQAIAAVIAIWMILMPVLPLRVVVCDIATSVSLVIKMCRVVKNIRTKDDLEPQIDTFNKLNIEISRRPHIFYSTIEYFKYFIWYRKWLYASKSSRKKQLLEEGLSLFGCVDDAPVYMYIYQKQIETEAKHAENYKKMRKIFCQKFTVYQNQEKIEAHHNLSKPRSAARKVKKSGFNKDPGDIQAESYSKDFCMIESQKKKIEERISKQLQLMEIQKKNKRYVRFSNDLHQDEKPLQFRVSKFLLNIPNQFISKSSQKSIEQEIKKKEQQDNGSNPVESSREQRILSDFKDQQSLYSEKNIQNWNMFLKFDQFDELHSQEDAEEDSFDLRRHSFSLLDEKLSESYQNLYRIYEKMIGSKKMYLDKQEITEVHEYMNKFYWMLVERLRYVYKFVKHKNSQREKMLKNLSRKLININREKRAIKDLDFGRRERLLGSERIIHESISVISGKIEEESKIIDLQFKQFAEVEEKYKIDPYLMQRARLYQTKLLKILNYPTPYKKLQSLCDSKNEEIRVEARIIMAQQFLTISPHADLQILSRAQQNLQESHTTNGQKQKTLKLISRVLKNRELMEEEECQIELITNYYNYNHKKVYFIVDLSDSYEIFRPTIAEIYRNMGHVDMFQIMNLAMNENLQDMVVCGSEIKPPKLTDFELRFENIHNEANRIRSAASTKLGSRRMAFQKDFNRIVSKIQQEVISLSKYVVLMLGGQNETQSRTHEDYQSSSAQNRQNYQMVHQEILLKLEKNYFHMILVGFNLRDYQTRQGKLKKYVRHTHDLLEIDLSKPNSDGCLKELAKFFHK